MRSYTFKYYTQTLLRLNGGEKNVFFASPQLPRKKKKIVTVRTVTGLSKTYGKKPNKPGKL